MSLSLDGVPDGQQEGQSLWPCPSVYSPATALGSLSSVALSSAPASLTLAPSCKRAANYHRFCAHIWSGFLGEATNTISSGFLREATGRYYRNEKSGLLCRNDFLRVLRLNSSKVFDTPRFPTINRFDYDICWTCNWNCRYPKTAYCPAALIINESNTRERRLRWGFHVRPGEPSVSGF